MPDSLTDTDKKIMRNDHDILIAVHTLLTETRTDFRAYMQSTNEKHEKAAVEMKALSIEQVRVNGELSAMKDDMKELKSKSTFLDAISIAFTAIVGTIMYFVFK